MGARKIHINPRSVTGTYYSQKNQGSISYESSLERDYLLSLELDPFVRRYEAQPLIIPYVLRGRSRRYFPDVMVQFREMGGQTRANLLVEVKYREDLRLDWFELRPKFKAAIHYARSEGMRFKIMSEVEIRDSSLAENARFLLPYRNCTPADDDLAALSRCFHSRSVWTPAEILEALGSTASEQARLLPVIWHALAWHRYRFDIHEKLTMNTRLEPTGAAI